MVHLSSNYPLFFAEMENKIHVPCKQKKTQKAAFSEGSYKNFFSQWRAFFAFCTLYSIAQWPVTEHVLCIFAQFLSHNFKAASSIYNYLSGVRTLHLLMGARPASELNHFEVQITMTGLKKDDGTFS